MRRLCEFDPFNLAGHIPEKGAAHCVGHVVILPIDQESGYVHEINTIVDCPRLVPGLFPSARSVAMVSV